MRRWDDRKQAEVEYPERIGEAGREWLRRKPFANEPRETARLWGALTRSLIGRVGSAP